jgi:putative FmdB family regulatory protein
MPLYSYYCKQCDIIYENLRSIKQRDITLVCTECNERCNRIIDISSFQLKGDGWAKDGYSNKKQKQKQKEKQE